MDVDVAIKIVKVVVPSSQVPEYHSQLQPWFQWSSELGVLLLEARRQPVEQEMEHVWRHAQVVSERLHIIVPELDHKVVVLAS